MAKRWRQLLSPALTDAVTGGPTLAQVVGTALMASVIAFQGWLSVAKPWGRTRLAFRGRGAAGIAGTAPPWVFAVTVVGGLADLALALAIGHPIPLLSITLLTIALVRRRTWSRHQPRTPALREAS